MGGKTRCGAFAKASPGTRTPPASGSPSPKPAVNEAEPRGPERARRLPPPRQWKLETPAGARELAEGVSSAPEVELFPGRGGREKGDPGSRSGGVVGC